MMKILRGIFFSACCLFVFTSSVNAQYVLKDADKQFDLFNYPKAIELYEQAYKKKESLNAAGRLGYAYAITNNFQQAESWFGLAVKMPGSPPENLLGYAKALQSNSKYREAKAQYKAYIEVGKKISEREANVWLASCDSALKWMKNPKQIELVNQKDLNSAQSDWGAVSYNGGVVFTSDRFDTGLESKEKSAFFKIDGTKMPDKKVYGWTGNGYLKLYIKPSLADSVKLFPIETGSSYHVGSATFTADGNTMYFTMTNVPEDLERVKNKPSTVNVSIYSSTKNADGIWGAPIPFTYNAINDYSVGDPFISTDGTSLYFSSNKPGGKGGADIYVCLKTDSGEWGNPVNLEEINTAGNERNPVFDANNNLYFASDGHIGMGGLDVFRALRDGAGIGRIENLGYPFNSPLDDFAFSLNEKGGVAYMSSNRSNGMGSDDIYVLDQKLILAFKLTGTVYNRKTNQPVAGALVTLAKVNGGSSKVETDDNGEYQFSLARESEYNVSAEATNYRTDVENLATIGLITSQSIVQDLHMEPIELNTGIRLENIYYDFEKWEIRADAALELDKLVKIMNDNPTIWVELGSHTDSRGNDAFNLSLSQKRAAAAVKYIISRGINKNRIEAKGYGETKLLNKCANAVDCSDAEHQLNRRTEFKITKQ